MQRRLLVIALVVFFAYSTEKADAASRCIKVPTGAIGVLTNHLQPGVTIAKARAVRSKDFKRVYFVSGELEGPNLDGPGDVATWAMNALRPSPTRPLPIVYSVDALAIQTSDWPTGDITPADNGFTKSRNCVGAT
jgi:hypothetical protein